MCASLCSLLTCLSRGTVLNLCHQQQQYIHPWTKGEKWMAVAKVMTRPPLPLIGQTHSFHRLDWSGYRHRRKQDSQHDVENVNHTSLCLDTRQLMYHIHVYFRSPQLLQIYRHRQTQYSDNLSTCSSPLCHCATGIDINIVLMCTGTELQRELPSKCTSTLMELDVPYKNLKVTVHDNGKYVKFKLHSPFSN